jgi:hypothetical protein
MRKRDTCREEKESFSAAPFGFAGRGPKTKKPLGVNEGFL